MHTRMQEYLSSYVPQTISDGYQNLKDKAYSAYQAVIHHRYAEAIYSGYQTITHNHYLRNFWDGFSQPISQLPEAIVAIKKSKNMQNVLWQTGRSGAEIFFSSIFYYGYVRPFLSEDYYVQQTTDAFFGGYLLAESLRFFVEDLINSTSCSCVTKELLPQNNKHFECECNPIDKGKGGFNTNIYYITHGIVIFNFSCYPYVGPLVNWLFSPWYLGVSLADYRFNMCDQHRYQVFSQNNANLMGLGAGVKLATVGISKLIEAKTGANSPYINLIVQSLVMKLAMLITVLREAPLPGKEYEMDFLYYFRFATSQFVQDNVNRLNQYLKHKKNELHPSSQEVSDEKSDDKTKLSLSDSKALYKLVKQSLSDITAWTIGKDYAHLNTLVQTNPVKLFIKLNEKSIKAILELVKGAHREEDFHPYAVAITKGLIKIMPAMLFPAGVGMTKKDVQFFIKIIYLNAVKQVLPTVINLVDHALEDSEQLRAEKEKKIQAEVKVVLYQLIDEVELRSQGLSLQTPITVRDQHVPRAVSAETKKIVSSALDRMIGKAVSESELRKVVIIDEHFGRTPLQANSVFRPAPRRAMSADSVNKVSNQKRVTR